MVLDLYSTGLMVLKGLLAGGSGLLLAMSSTTKLTRSVIFADVTGAIVSVYLVSILYENYWVLGEGFLMFVGFLLTAYALLAIANYFRGEAEKDQLAVSLGIFTSGAMGVIIGLNMVLTGFVSILLITVILHIGKMLISEEQ